MKKEKRMINGFVCLIFLSLLIGSTACEKDSDSAGETTDDLPDISGYPIVGTNQTVYYDNSTEIPAPSEGDQYYGQNAFYPGNIPEYKDNGNGTVTDLVTGLMWQQSCDMNADGIINAEDKMSYDEAMANAASFNLAGYNDWRLPTIKEAYSLILFSGEDPSGIMENSFDGFLPFIDNHVFDFEYGDTDAGERMIDAQFATTTIYNGLTMGDNKTMFGVNFADGRIKGYPTGPMPGQNVAKQFYVLYVRGNSSYGANDFVDNGNGTISDKATGLMWMAEDNGEGLMWKDALGFAERFEFAGYSDWRLPDAKELQSIVDYSRSPSGTNSAAIDPLFSCTEIINEAGEKDFACYWTSTTHANQTPDAPGRNAAYICFGKAMGFMNQWIDVHGAGAQRSDPKDGDPADYPTGHGPQGDAIRSYNFVRLVRTIK